MRDLFAISRYFCPGLLVLFVGLMSLPVQAQQDYSDVELNVLTVELGSLISGTMRDRGQEFQQQTNAKVNIHTVPFGELYDAISQSFKEGAKKYDAFVYASQWSVDFTSRQYFVDLTERVQVDEALDWYDISPFFREFSSKYRGDIFSIPLDGDLHLLYYRADVFEKYNIAPPQTWEEYLTIAKRLHGKDLNGDGKADYGSCISKKPNEQSYWSLMSIAAPFLQTKGTSQGVFFNKKNMQPLVNNAAFKKALQIYAETNKYGPPGELKMDTNGVRFAFIDGECALAIDWGDIGTMSMLERSQVNGKTGVVILPGSREVLNRQTGELEACRRDNCPYAINGINHAPYAAFGGWVGSVSQQSPERNRAAAYDLLSYISQPAQSNEDVTKGATGFNPYRISHVVNRDPWRETGMQEAAMHYYLGAIAKSINHANIVLDLRIYRNNDYLGDVLDREAAKLLNAEQSVDETAANIEAGWNEISVAVGRALQLNAYRTSLGWE